MMFRININNHESVTFVEFQGAVCDIDDAGNMVDFVPRGPIVLNISTITGYYDHTILIEGRKIRVMETCDEISRKIGRR